jgi:hypothetical protein
MLVAHVSDIKIFVRPAGLPFVVPVASVVLEPYNKISLECLRLDVDARPTGNAVVIWVLSSCRQHVSITVVLAGTEND